MGYQAKVVLLRYARLSLPRFLEKKIGTVCSRMGDDNKAVSYFNKVVALGKDTASENLSTFLVNLGMAKIKLGLKADANSACQEALLIGKRNNLSEVCSEANECIKLVQAT